MSEANGEQASKRPRREASKQVAVATAAAAAGSDDEGANGGNDNASSAAAALPKPNLPGAAAAGKEEEEDEEDTAPTAEMLNELFAADEEGDYFDDDHEPEELQALAESDPRRVTWRKQREEARERKRTEEQKRYADNLKLLIDSFTPEQRERHEMFVRSKFNKSSMKNLMQNILGYPVDDTTRFVMSSLAKVYVGEVVEMALDIQSETNASGALKPWEIREAVRRLQKQEWLPSPEFKHQRLFKR